ncbi:ankyrin repeat and SAM domain-containing protein 3-like [Stylophora pistillata]|uniref:Ankyrin repeat and SAM domain-containing protein 3 n=1 Tax=Stylophora pistillata TaxID=50429 RepID=A0A2B4RYB5_STYPI|nr:ankyrin repeat and SAM domain-containing protein 3-like [Stylophora pistillata]PFX22621.1 Ankyrin repeat and SAM domain-containing protein 3 [Stylophora pistillata]
MEAPNENIYGRAERSASFTDVNDCTCSNLWNEDEVIPMDIYTACSIGEYSCVRQHLADGVELADLDRPNCSGWTPLMYAAYVGHDNIVNLLLDCHVNVNAITAKNGATALMLAASCGNESVVYFLLQKGAKIDAQDKRGWTGLFYATYQGHHKVVQLLLENGADKELREYRLGLTPLLAAAKEGHEVIFEELVRSNANMTAHTNRGEDAQSLALQNGNMTVVNIINQQAFLNLPNIMLRSEPGLVPDYSDNVEDKVCAWQQKNVIPNIGIQDGPEAFKKLMSSHQNDRKPVNIPSTTGEQERAGHFVGSPYCLANTPGTPVGSYESEHFFINCGRTVQSASLHKKLQKMHSSGSDASRSPQLQAEEAPLTKPSIANFLDELKLTKYIPTFEEQDVDFTTLLTLTESDLKEVGIYLFGPRRKILTAISEWKRENNYPNTENDRKALEECQHQAHKIEVQLLDATSEVKQLQKHFSLEKDLRLCVEGCLVEEKAKRQEIYTRVCQMREHWQQVEEERENLKSLCRELEENGNFSQARVKEVHCKLERSVENLGKVVQLGKTGINTILYVDQSSQTGNSSESSGNSSS